MAAISSTSSSSADSTVRALVDSSSCLHAGAVAAAGGSTQGKKQYMAASVDVQAEQRNRNGSMYMAG
jgi:hypothetical protein